ncbi:hypothetical protein [Reyranella sp. CPCC 100927]|uniref:hypothetical protein n=1 Tax=Reyranella sp. CPCC 100927 TaxID=2599616 RepID=UPI0011B7F6A5|nr:hypothetical protein [Reyranella sp. CPCC 100927]TWS99883.1 hypothetical protein FQU96_34355 [Reyranella sp. CPCC 100927]
MIGSGHNLTTSQGLSRRYGPACLAFSLAMVGLQAPAAAQPADPAVMRATCGGGNSRGLGVTTAEMWADGRVVRICPKTFGQAGDFTWRLNVARLSPDVFRDLRRRLDDIGFDHIRPEGEWRSTGPHVPNCRLEIKDGSKAQSVRVELWRLGGVYAWPLRQHQDDTPAATEATRKSAVIKEVIDALRAAAGGRDSSVMPCPAIKDVHKAFNQESVIASCVAPKTRGLIIEAQVDPSGVITLWDNAVRPGGASWERIPVPVAFDAFPIPDAAAMIARLDAANYAASPGSPLLDMVCSLKRRRLINGQGQDHIVSWQGLVPPDTVPAVVRETFERIRRHTNTLPERKTFKLLEAPL